MLTVPPTWLAAVPAFGDQLDDRIVTFLACPVDLVIMIDPLDIHIGRDAGHLEAVDLGEFTSFRHGRSGHAGQLLIQPEVILESHRSDGLVLGLDFQTLARLDGLMQPF